MEVPLTESRRDIGVVVAGHRLGRGEVMVSMAGGGRTAMQSNGQHLGVTEPISTAGPTELDLTKTRELEKVVAESCRPSVFLLLAREGGFVVYGQGSRRLRVTAF